MNQNHDLFILLVGLLGGGLGMSFFYYQKKIEAKKEQDALTEKIREDIKNDDAKIDSKSLDDLVADSNARMGDVGKKVE